MAATTETLERETKLQGMGTSRLRKEDARFIRGKGTYVDDIKLPGMLFGAIVRSPYAHARIKSINKAKALAVPGRRRGAHRRRSEAGEAALDAHARRRRAGGAGGQEGLLPDAGSRDGDRQRPLRAADGADAVEVDYEELPAIVDPHKSMAPDAPIIREDIADKDEVGHGKRTHPNHIFTWEAGDKAAHRCGRSPTPR